MKRRSGFTLVELMVAMALIMFIMAILSEAFGAAMKSFRDLKASADMAERLRAAGTMLRRELSADHFDGKARMSQPDFWANGPRPEGFFRVYQATAPTFEGSDPNELGTTQAQRLLNSYRAVNQMLHYTVKLRGNERGDFFSAGSIPATGTELTTSSYLLGPEHYEENNSTVYNSQWAEVAYFLRATTDSAQGTQLYALYRRQRLLVPDNGLLGTTAAAGAFTATAVTGTASQYPEMSIPPTIGAGNAAANLYFNNPRDITMPIRRLGMNTLAGTLSSTDPITNALTYPTMYDSTNNNTLYQNADLILTDVVSFEVRLLLGDGNHFESLFDITGAAGGYRSVRNATTPLPFPTNNSSFTTAGPLVFDTWSSGQTTNTGLGGAETYSTWNTANTATSIPLYQRVNAGTTTTIQVRAVQVTIRVWDVKTEQTRQITIVQDL